MSVCIKWKSCLSEGIVIERGTRQGGLSSPILFNLFYKGLIDTLQSISCKIHINNVNFNTICYADDILLCSTTVTGSQKMINPFVTPPIWTMEGDILNIEIQISYLGTFLVKKCGTSHCESRIRGATRAFYGLHGCTTTYLTKTNLLKLDRYQGKIVKQCLGRITPLLKAMCVDAISVSVCATSMELLKACMLRNSLCQDLYNTPKR